MRSIIFLFLLVHCVHFGSKDYVASSLDYFFDELQIKEYEKMSELISPWVNKLTTPIPSSKDASVHPESLLRDLELDDLDGTSEGDYGYYARKTFMTIFSRPDRDQVNQRLIKNLRSKPFINDNYFSLLKVIARQSSLSLKNKNRSPIERATHFYILENIIGELRASITKSSESQKILEQIANANIKIPQEVHQERYIRALQPQTASPSSIARQILRKIKKMGE